MVCNEQICCSYNSVPCDTNGEYAVNLSAVYANSLKIKENSTLLLYKTDNIKVIKHVTVIPESISDWQILETSPDIVQDSLLNQIRIISVNQIIPIWISKSFVLKVRVNTIDDDIKAGRLAQYTEITVLCSGETNVTSSPHVISDKTVPKTRSQIDPKNIYNHSDDDCVENDVSDDDNDMENENINCIAHRENINDSESSWSKYFNYQVFNSLFYTQESASAKKESCTGYNSSNMNQMLAHDRCVLTYLPMDWLHNCMKTQLPSLIQPYDVFVNKTYFPFFKRFQKNKNKKYIIAKLRHICYEDVSTKPSTILNYRNEKFFDNNEEIPEVFVRVFLINVSSDNLSLNKSIPFIFMSRVISEFFNVKTGSKMQLHMIRQQTIKWNQSYKIQVLPAMEMTELEKADVMSVLQQNILLSHSDCPMLFNNASVYEISSGNKRCKLLIKFHPPCIPFVEISAQEFSNPEQQLLWYDESSSNQTFSEPDGQLLCCDESYKNKKFSDSDQQLQFERYEAITYPFTFWKSIIEELVRAITVNLNLLNRYNSEEEDAIVKTNHLILAGSQGTGKTAVFDILKSFLLQMHIYAHVCVLSCKNHRGKTIPKLEKHLREVCSTCAYYEPSIIIMDNLDSLFQGQVEHPDYVANKNNAERLSNMIFDTFREYSAYRITVIASVSDPNVLPPRLYDPRGNALFTNLVYMPNLTQENRVEVLGKLVFNRFTSRVPEIDSMYIENLARQMEGYCMQDFTDFSNKLFFELIKDCGLCTDEMLGIHHIEKAVSLVMPVSLQGINLHKSAGFKYEDVGGMDSLKQTLREIIIWPSLYPSVFKQCPIRAQSGVLLYGAPGAGKTLLAAALAGECNINFISVKGPELLSKYIGSSEERVRGVFEKAESAKPCILFFDEFESLASRRGTDTSGVTDRVVNQLLTEMDGIESRDGVWILAATSRPDLLDPALLRPGRLGTKIYCPLPDEDDRLSILKILTSDISLSEDVDLPKIASMTDKYTGADIKSVLYTAWVISHSTSDTYEIGEALPGNRFETRTKLDNEILSVESKATDTTHVICHQHLLNAVNITEPSLKENDRVLYERIYTAFHESKYRALIADNSSKLLTFA